jgi:hypothetical protein
MDKNEKVKEYYKKYYKDYIRKHREKYSEYSRNYYNQNKEKYKKYYETYKKVRLAKKKGTYIPAHREKRTKRELETLRWERKLRKNEERRLAFIEHLKLTGQLPSVPTPDDNEADDSVATSDDMGLSI